MPTKTVLYTSIDGCLVERKKSSERKLIGAKFFLIRFPFWHRTLNITFRASLHDLSNHCAPSPRFVFHSPPRSRGLFISRRLEKPFFPFFRFALERWCLIHGILSIMHLSRVDDSEREKRFLFLRSERLVRFIVATLHSRSSHYFLIVRTEHMP